MTDNSVPGFGDLIALMGGAGLLAPITKTIDQMKRGVSEFLAAVENFNRTMETFNDIAVRASALFDEVEEPIRAFMPQLTRSIKAADAVINQISGPIDKVAPGINRLADVLNSQAFATMPTDVAGFVEILGEVARRLQPLAQMAESAGGLFGLRQFTSILGGGSQQATPPPPAAVVVVAPPPPPAPPKKAAPRKAQAPAKKAAPRKAPAKKAPAPKKPTPKKAAAPKKTAAKKTAAKR